MNISARPLWILAGLALIVLGFQGKVGTALAALLSPDDVQIDTDDSTGGGTGGGSFD